MAKKNFGQKGESLIPAEKKKEVKTEIPFEREIGRETEEKEEAFKERESEEKITKTTSSILLKEPFNATAKNPVLNKIENILEEDLKDIYFSLDEPLKKEFRIKGEETASKINFLLQKTKIVFKQIFDLIKEWLKIIPGINKFFAEQEAKIKTDKILKLTKK